MNDQDLSAVLSRLEALEAENAIRRTMSDYAHALDYGPAAALADCFTEDGDLQVRDGAGNVLFRASGREAVFTFGDKHGVFPAVAGAHFSSVPQIDVQGATASSTSYFWAGSEADGKPILQAFGRFRDRLRREADGRWRFAERIVDMNVSNGRTQVERPSAIYQGPA